MISVSTITLIGHSTTPSPLRERVGVRVNAWTTSSNGESLVR